MKIHRSSRGAVSPLLHWLLVVGGLALLALSRSDDPGEVVGLVLGTVSGTLLGHLLGSSRAKLRMVVVALIVMSIPLTVFNSAAVGSLGLTGHDGTEESLMAFVPATLCAYASLSEVAGLVGFWFPAALWTVGLLDGASGSGALPPRSWFFLGVLAVLFVAMLRARETRRISLWQRHGAVRLAVPKEDVVLREAPFRALGNVGFSMIVGSIALMMTAWVAPLLWQVETGQGAVSAASSHAAGGHAELPGGVACCPGPASVEGENHRIKEYFSLRGSSDAPPPPASCTPCGLSSSGEPLALSPGVAGPTDQALAPVAPMVGPAGIPGPQPLQGESSPGPVTAQGATDWAAAPPGPAPVAPSGLAPSAPKPTFAGSPPVAPDEPASPTEPSASVAVSHAGWATSLGPLLRLLLTLLVCVPIVHLGLRPLRRLVVLRHLRSPLWPESADQRVSNLWHLMLVGLKDAGYRASDDEQPQALATRIGLDGMSVCATVLDRVRHGASLAAEDLVEMRDAAQGVYRAARSRLPWVVRAGSALRWPLV